MSRVEPNRNVYVGHRYVPKIFGEWDKTNDYEGLSIVTHQGASYTSKKRVPVGIDILNEEFWVVTGNYNAQVETYRDEVKSFKGDVDDYQTLTDTKIESQNKKIDSIIINPVDYGAKFDGLNDDTQAINDALQTAFEKGNSDVLLSGNVSVNSTIEIPEGVSLKSNNAVIKPKFNINVLSFNRNTKIKGNLLIDVTDLGESYNQSVLYFDGRKKLSYRDILIENIMLLGHNARGQGKAVHFDSSQEDSNISFVTFDNLVIRGFEFGVYLDAPLIESTTFYNYINGNIFNNLIISDCDYYIYGTGGHDNNRNQATGNTFSNAQLQYSGRAKEILHLEGRSNVFNGYVWDASYKDVIIMNLTPSSQSNTINSYGSKDLNLFIDNGRDNVINILDDNYDIAPFKTPLSIGERATRYEGEHTNVLHKADSLHNVNALTGSDKITGGNISNIFNSFESSSLNLNLSTDSEFSLEIDFNGKNFTGKNTDYIQSGLKNLGVVFGDGRVPNKVEFKVYTDAGVEAVTEIDMSKRSNRPYFFIKRDALNGLARNIQKIVITLKGQVSSDVRLSRVVASSYYMTGNTFMSNAGGIFTGDVDMKDNFFKIGVRNYIPTANAEQRGRIIRIEGGEGVADQVLTCVKNVDGTFEWVSIF